MSHDIYQSESGQWSQAHRTSVGRKNWHGLGQVIEDGDTLEQIAAKCGFGFEVLKATAQYLDSTGTLRDFPERQVFFRSDNGNPLEVASNRFRLVQPREVLEFFRDLCADQGWALETAGVLAGGAKYWAQARVNGSVQIDGNEHRSYMLLATSCDKTMATVHYPTDVCVVCANTLRMSQVGVNLEDGKTRTSHRSTFDPQAVKQALGLIDYLATREAHVEKLNQLSQIRVSKAAATEFYSELLRPAKEDKAVNEWDAAFRSHQSKALMTAGTERAIRGLADLEHCYVDAPGARPGSAYGLVQGLTYWIDHERGKSEEKRTESALFGQGNALKSKAFDLALELA
jgi:phage/plasmid-like protein (TIGR03299 family)